jgi:putative aldouronate transport system permease protein
MSFGKARPSLAARRKGSIGRNFELYIMLIPVIAFYLLFRYGPMYGILIAFKNYNVIQGVWKSPWVGLTVFQHMFQERTFLATVFNTLRLNLLSLVFCLPAPIILALLLNELRARRLKRVVQSITYLPHFISWVIVYGIMLSFFEKNNGIVNNLIRSVGLKEIPFLTNNVWWLATYIGSGIWKDVGWEAIIYMSALSMIDADIYEAAWIDGASRARCMWSITLPSIKSTISTLFILNVGWLISIGFEQPFLLGNSLVSDVSSVLSTYIYQLGILKGNFSFTTAVGLFQSAINFLLIVVINRAVKMTGETGIW